MKNEVRLNFTNYDLFYRNLESDKRIIVESGGSSCFSSGQLVEMAENESLKMISEVRPGNKVITHNEHTGKDESKTVIQTHCYLNKKQSFVVKLKNGGEIRATGDHLFMFNGKWTRLDEILKLWQLTKSG